MKTLTMPNPTPSVDIRWVREQVMLWHPEADANLWGPNGNKVIRAYLPDDDPHTLENLQALVAAFPAGWMPQNEIDSAQDLLASDLVLIHLNKLRTLPPADQVYALMGRMMAKNDNASQAQIDAIINRTTAGAYVTGKPEWVALPAASKAWMIDMLDMLASILQLMIVRLR